MYPDYIMKEKILVFLLVNILIIYNNDYES